MEEINYNKRVVGLVPLAFLIHNIEEIITAKSFMPYYDYTDFTYTSFALGVVLLSLLVVAIFRFVEKYKCEKYYLHFNAGLLIALGINSFIPHIAGAIYFKSYFPGLVSAILLYLPLVWYVFKNDIKPNLHSQSLKRSLIVVPIGILLLAATSLAISYFVCPLIFG